MDTQRSGMCLHLSQCATWQLFPLAWLQVFWEMARKFCTGCWHIQGHAQTSLLLRGLSVSTELNMYSRLACLMSNINTLIKVTTRYLLYSNVSFVQLICKMALHFLTINSISTWVDIVLVEYLCAWFWTGLWGKWARLLRDLHSGCRGRAHPQEKETTGHWRRESWAMLKDCVGNAARRQQGESLAWRLVQSHSVWGYTVERIPNGDGRGMTGSRNHELSTGAQA